ncbi:type IX secretion system membrane protein PorP/SprF, partial [bacterium AH-315-A23]|nr:type IX secretion system membrane protein PorP/SprF [bacterium AH-315-A23]
MKISIKSIATLLFALIGLESYSQQEPLFTQYYNNFSLINPAYSGSHGHFTATANIRTQWAGQAGSPETQTFSVHGAMGKNVGLGLSLVHDKVFIWNNTDIYADFSYAFAVLATSTLSFGLKAGGSFLDVNLQELGISDDPLLNENINKFNPNLGVGVFYYTDKLYASVSTVNLLETTHYDENSSTSKASDKMVFYLSAGTVFEMGETLKFRPSFLTRMVAGSPLSTDVSASFLWNDRLEFALSHRFNASISGLFQVRINNHVKVGYSYDKHTNNLGDYNSGSHEISL